MRIEALKQPVLAIESRDKLIQRVAITVSVITAIALLIIQPGVVAVVLIGVAVGSAILALKIEINHSISIKQRALVQVPQVKLVPDHAIVDHEVVHNAVEQTANAMIVLCEERLRDARDDQQKKLKKLVDKYPEGYFRNLNGIQRYCVQGGERTREVVDPDLVRQAADDTISLETFKETMKKCAEDIFGVASMDLKRGFCVRWIDQQNTSNNDTFMEPAFAANNLPMDEKEWPPPQQPLQDVESRIDILRDRIAAALSRRGLNPKECYLQSWQILAMCHQLIFTDYQCASWLWPLLILPENMSSFCQDQTLLPPYRMTMTAKSDEVLITAQVWIKLFIGEGNQVEVWRISVILSDQKGKPPRYVIEPERKIDLQTGQKRLNKLPYDPKDSALKRAFLPKLLALHRQNPTLLPHVEFRIPGLTDVLDRGPK